MKAKAIIFMVAIIICVAVSLIYHRDDSGSGHQRIDCVKNCKQIGLAFRMSHDDFSGQFSLTGSVVLPNL